jgi:hypothetical protein
LSSIKEEKIYDTKEYDNKPNRQKKAFSNHLKIEVSSEILFHGITALRLNRHLELSGKHRLRHVVTTVSLFIPSIVVIT